jgi:hypothetical protein
MAVQDARPWVTAALATVRLGFAVFAGAAPGRFAAAVGVADEQLPAARPYAWALAGRELVLGVGPLVTLRRGGTGAGWVAAMAVWDGVDTLAYELLGQAGTLDRAASRRAAVWAASGLMGESATAVWLARSPAPSR